MGARRHPVRTRAEGSGDEEDRDARCAVGEIAGGPQGAAERGPERLLQRPHSRAHGKADGDPRPREHARRPDAPRLVDRLHVEQGRDRRTVGFRPGGARDLEQGLGGGLVGGHLDLDVLGRAREQGLQLPERP